MDNCSLKLGNWNARSIQNKTRELAEFLRNHHLDVIALTETHLKPNISFHLPGYKIFRMDRIGAAKGGVAIATRREFNVSILPCFNLKIIEAIGVEIITTSGKLIIIAAYCPKQANIRDGTAALLKQDIIKLTRWRNKFIMAGDLNARHEAWGNVRRNQNGSILNDVLMAGNFTILSPEQPTFFSPAGVPSILDIFLSNIDRQIGSPLVLEELPSDHYPVVIELGETAETRRLRRYNYRRVNWTAFQRTVDLNIDLQHPLVTTGDIDGALLKVEEAITTARQMHVRQTPVVSSLLEIDSMTKFLIRLRNIYRRQFQRTRLIEKKLVANRLSSVVQARILDLRNKDFAKKMMNG